MQGLGQILKEDIRFDEAPGQLLTGSFMDYANAARASTFALCAVERQSGSDKNQSARR